jgi:Lipase (class 3)
MDAAEAMSLAAISYRGCELNVANLHSHSIVAAEILRCLRTFPAVRDRWELVWGPAGYHTAASVLDISAMYAVRSLRDPSTTAIVVRGTNPFSWRDWLSNLLIDLKPWPYGGAPDTVRISYSTHFGLSILQALQDVPLPAPDATQSVMQSIQAAAARTEARIGYALLEKIVKGKFQGRGEELLIRALELIVTGSIAAEWGNDADDINLVDTSHGSARDTTLFEFLRAYVANAGDALVTIEVIGHSKGGALAAALALWLADTQGMAVAAAYQWDPSTKARIKVWSFVAPTPGNAGFAGHFAQKLPDAYRLANPYDLVTHAWNADEFEQVPTLYGEQSSELQQIVKSLEGRLRESDYQHEIRSAQWTGAPLPQSGLLQRAAIEHLDAYLRVLGIYDERNLNILSLFAPIG